MRELLRNLSLSLVSLALTVSVVEGCARLFDLRPAPRGNVVPAWVEERQLRREGPWIEELAESQVLARYFELYEWDRFLFYRLRPNVRLEMLDYSAPRAARPRTGWRVEIDEAGFRRASEPGSVAQDGHRFRVLALGDSSTFGWGVPAVDTYAAVAQSVLRRRHPDRGIEVLNLGVPGYSSFQGRVLLQRVALDLEPDALLFSFGSNDGTPTGVSDRETYARRTSFMGALQAAVHASRAYETLAAWWTRLRGGGAPAAERMARKGRLNVSSQDYLENLRAAAHVARVHEVPLAFVSNCVNRKWRGLMSQVAKETGVPFLDSHAIMTRRLPELRAGSLLPEASARMRQVYGDDVLEAPDSIYWVFLPDRCHPNPVGHRLLGEAVAELVEDWLVAEF